jgi:hypothetical protein
MRRVDDAAAELREPLEHIAEGRLLFRRLDAVCVRSDADDGDSLPRFRDRLRDQGELCLLDDLLGGQPRDLTEHEAGAGEQAELQEIAA